jgi:sarcosine oxidase delta subunit
MPEAYSNTLMVPVGTKQAVYHNEEGCGRWFRGGRETGSGGLVVTVAEELTEADEKKLEEWKEKLRVWKQGEAVVNSRLRQPYLTLSS